MKKIMFLKNLFKKEEPLYEINSFLVNYNWINQKNTIFRSLPPEFIIKHILKIEYPNFKILKQWIIDEKNDPMGVSNYKNKDIIKKKIKKKIYNIKKKNENYYRLIGDYSPTVSFKSNLYEFPLKLSRYNLLNLLRKDISSKFNEMFGSDIILADGLYEISLNLTLALEDLNNNVGKRKLNEINVISFLNTYLTKENIKPHGNKYGIIRGLMQDIIFIESNSNLLRGGLNVFHLMTLLGWKSAFKFEGLTLYFETLINNLVIGIKSFIERIWRFTHEFFNIKYIKKEIKKEFRDRNCSDKWITPLEIIYSIIEKICTKYDIEKFNQNDSQIKLHFDDNNGETLLLLNNLRNTYIHSIPKSISGVEKEKLISQIQSGIQIYEIFNLYILSIPLIKNLENLDFKNYLNTNNINTSNIDLNNSEIYRKTVKYRIKWRSPTIINNMLDNIESPNLYEKIPGDIFIGVEIPEEKIVYLSPRKIIGRITKQIKEIDFQKSQKISIFNLSDCIDSLFSFLKNLLKFYIINEIKLETN